MAAPKLKTQAGKLRWSSSSIVAGAVADALEVEAKLLVIFFAFFGERGKHG
jgi:hypothetical protein